MNERRPNLTTRAMLRSAACLCLVLAPLLALGEAERFAAAALQQDGHKVTIFDFLQNDKSLDALTARLGQGAGIPAVGGVIRPDLLIDLGVAP